MVSAGSLALSIASVLSGAAALSPVTISGNAFFNGSSDRFFIRGVDYQPGGSSNLTDPLADDSTCLRDVKYFQDLGVNTIRVYTVDNSLNHDQCMQALEEAGIYLILDVNSPRQSLNRYDESTLRLSYNSGYLQHIFATIDAFKNYTNTLGFFAANEVINSDNTTIAAPYVKAVVRDMKAYIKAQSNRTIPVGYSAADVATNRWQQMTYLNCDQDEGSRIDMFGMNDYSWCGPASSFTISGWSQNVKNYGNYSVPMFLSEYGCNTIRPRTFPEIGTLYSEQMSPVYSGGLVYEFFNAANDYGLVQENGDSVEELPDYGNFKSALAAAPNPSGSAGAETTRSPASCPTYESGVWEVNNTVAPPMPTYASRYLTAGAGKPLGLNGPDTQDGSYNDIPGHNDSSSSKAQSTTSTSSKSSSSSQRTSSSSKKTTKKSTSPTTKASESTSESSAETTSATTSGKKKKGGKKKSTSSTADSTADTDEADKGTNGATSISTSTSKSKNGAVQQTGFLTSGALFLVWLFQMAI